MERVVTAAPVSNSMSDSCDYNDPTSMCSTCYTTGSQLMTCGDMIGVHESTACRVIHRVTHAIASLRQLYVVFPSSESELINLTEFSKIAKFPRTIGAIDCTHIRIISPGGENAEIYRNRKGYFSINTQCVASANLKFLDIVARWHSSANDSNIWDNCVLKGTLFRVNIPTNIYWVIVDMLQQYI